MVIIPELNEAFSYYTIITNLQEQFSSINNSYYTMDVKINIIKYLSFKNLRMLNLNALIIN